MCLKILSINKLGTLSLRKFQQTKKNYKLQDLVIYFTRYHPDKSMRMLNLYYDKLIGEIEEYEGKRQLMVDDYKLGKVIHQKRFKEQGLKNFEIPRI